MKRTVLFVTTGLLLSQNLAFAQSGVIPVVSGGKGGAFVGNAGNYNIDQTINDNSAVMRELIQRTAQIQNADREYLMSIANRLNNHLKDLVNLKLKYTQLSQQAALKPVNFTDYLSLTNEIVAKNEILVNEIQTQTLITRESLPSFDMTQAGSMTASTPAPGNINMGPLMSRVEALRAQIYNDINNTQFNFLITPLSQTFSVKSNALSPNLSGIRILSQQQIQDYTNDIRLKLTLSADTMKYQQNSAEQLISLMRQFTQNYGTSEWLRFQNNNDQEASKIALKSITDGFFLRSYLRKKLGIRMGAIQPIGYNKIVVNLEDFKMQPLKLALQNFRAQPALNETELNQAFENARNFLELYDKKVTPVFASRAEILRSKMKGQDFLSQNTNALIRINSAVTYMTGQRRTAEILRDLMILALADIREEQMLVQNDLAAQSAFHDKRYRSTETAKTETFKRMCQIDFSLPQSVHDANCPKVGVTKKAVRPTIQTGRSNIEIFANILTQYNNVEKSKRQEARFKEELIAAALEAGKTEGEKAQEQKDAEELFN